MKPILIALVLTLVACGASQKQEPDGPASPAELPTGPITFDFALPEGLQGTMSLEGVTEKRGRTTSMSVRYPLSTRADADGLVLVYGEATDIETPTLTEQERAMLLPLVMVVPTIVFEDGAVTKIFGFEDFRQRLEEMLAPTFEQLPMLKPQMEAMLTPEFFLAAAQDEWMWRGHAFHGRTLEVGGRVEEEVELPMMFVEQKIPAKYVMTFVEVLPCPDAADRACVRLERELVIDPADAKQALGKLGETMDMERSTKAILIADAETLLPYRFEKYERTHVEFKNGTTEAQTERKEVVETYEWH